MTNVPITAGTGTAIDTNSMTDGSTTVHRQVMNLGDPTAVLGVAGVTAKGAQGAYALATQDIKDAGRARVTILFMAVAPAVADTLLSLTKMTNGVAATAATSVAVASGKTLRLTSVSFSIKSGAAAAAFATATIRTNPTGATVIGSPAELRLDVGNTAATVGAADKVEAIFPDGLEWSGTQTLGISLAAQAVTNVISISLHGFEY